MSRRFVGTWADQLFSVTQTQAIAALGVLAGSAPRNSRLDTAEQIATALHAAAPGSEGPVGVRYLRWGAYDKTTWDELKQRMKPALAAAGWERFTRSFGRVDLRVISQPTQRRRKPTGGWRIGCGPLPCGSAVSHSNGGSTQQAATGTFLGGRPGTGHCAWASCPTRPRRHSSLSSTPARTTGSAPLRSLSILRAQAKVATCWSRRSD